MARRFLWKSEHLMEIKAGAAMPLWLTRLLSDFEIYPISFSKYGRIYLKTCNGRRKTYVYQYNQHDGRPYHPVRVHLYTVFYPAGLYHCTCIYEVRSILKNVCSLTRSAPPAGASGHHDGQRQPRRRRCGARRVQPCPVPLHPGSAKEICAIFFLRWRSALRQEWAMSPLRQR